MPITQARMISLIDASRKILDHIASASAILSAAASGMETEGGKLTLARASMAEGNWHEAGQLYESAFADLKQITLEQILSWRDIQMDALLALTREETHFNIRKRSNNHAREHMRQIRANRSDPDPIPQTNFSVPEGSLDDDGIPEIPASYSREDYERDRRVRQTVVGKTIVGR